MVDNHGRTETDTSERQYQTLLQDPHDYDYPNLAGITRRHSGITTPREPPAQSYTNNTREYHELTDYGNGQQTTGVDREYPEVIDDSHGQQGLEYDYVTSPGSHIQTDDHMVISDNQTYLPANTVQNDTV